MAAAVAWAAYMMAESLPYWPINPTLSPSPWITFQIDLLRSLMARVSGGVPVGRELSARDRGGRGTRSGRRDALVGRVYAANTVGAIVGSVLFSVLVIPMLGTQQAERLLIAIAIVSAIVVFASLRRASGAEPATKRDRIGASARSIRLELAWRRTRRSRWCSRRRCRRFRTDSLPTGDSFRRTRRSRSISTSARG